MKYSAFVDANVILDILLRRKNWQSSLQSLVSEDKEFFISPLTVHLCYHFCLNQSLDFDVISNYLGHFKILVMDKNVVALAQQRYEGKDFEDCLQASCAELAGCNEIITRDKNFKAYSGTTLNVIEVA